MANTTPRALPGMGLTGAWPPNFKGWDAGMNENLLKLSAIAQLTLNQLPSAALPPSPTDGMIVIDPSSQEVCIRDAGAWVRVTPVVGWTAVFNTTIYRFSGSSWDSLVSPGFANLGDIANSSDFNALTISGVGSVPSDAAAGTMTNIPEPAAGTLYVSRLDEDGDDFTQMYLTQTGNFYYRGMPGGGWKSPQSSTFDETVTAPNVKLLNTASTDVNTLDFYEEGVFTPTFTGATTPGAATYSSRSGSYTRIGNRVTATGQIAISSKGGAVGVIRLGGLPFPVAGVHASVAFGYFLSLNTTAGNQVTGLAISGESHLNLYQTQIGGSPSLLNDTHVNDTFGVYFSVVYEAAA